MNGTGLIPSIRVSFQDLLGHKQEFLLPGPGANRLFVDCGWEGSPVTGPFQNLQIDGGFNPGTPRPWPRETGASLWTASGSIPRMEVGKSIA